MDTALPSIGRLFWRWIGFHGLDAERLFAECGLTEKDLQSPRNRIVVDQLDRILAAALASIEDQCCGIHAARCWHPSDLGALGYAWLASSTLRTAIQRVERYSRIVGERATILGIDTPVGLKVVIDQKPRDPLVRSVMADVIIAVLLDMSRFNFGAALRPVDVTLKRERSDCATRYQDFYGCEVRFAQNEDSFTFSLEVAERPLPTANKQLAGLHDEFLAQQLAGLDRTNTLAQCKAFVLENLTSGEVSSEQVAKALHMTPRTLARRLEAQGATLRALVDEVRADLANRYLADPMKSITEVAFLLGFSHPSSLSRAAIRWFGVSPNEYRNAQLKESA